MGQKSQTLKLTDEVEALDLALYLSGERTLVLADVHLGYEAALLREGTLLPKRHLQALSDRLSRILDKLEISAENPLHRVIINGDLSHQFGFLTYQESLDSFHLLNRLDALCNEIILLKGNHDGNLMPLTESGKRVLVYDSYQLGSVLFMHGNKELEEIPESIKTIVIGHEHPAIGLRDRVTGRVELYKCFLVGEYRGAKLVVQPSFNPLAQGSDLTRESCLSPLLDERRILNFEVYPVSDEGIAIRFGLLGDLIQSEEELGARIGQHSDPRS
jgi:hypothetical protein